LGGALVRRRDESHFEGMTRMDFDRLIPAAAAACLLAASAGGAAAASFSKLLTDAGTDVSVKAWKITSREVPGSVGKWSITKRTLAGGRQEGVEIIEVDNGAMRFTVVPTRGFSVWRAQAGDVRLGWDSPVDEIVHPQYVDLGARGGLGWLDGFGGWVVRCGLESNGAPGKDGGQFLNLHGRIDYQPASHVEVSYEAQPTPRIVLRGVVDESLMFGPHLRLQSEISTPVGTAEIQFNDTVTNLSDVPQEMELLYHTNFGTPLVGAGTQFVAPVKTMAPRDPRAAEGDINRWASYQGPQPAGYTEQVYMMELQADADGKTEVMLKGPGGDRGASLRFNVRQLPYFSLWKNEAPSKTGYVSGLEPATNFPYPRANERTAGRVPTLPAGGSAHFELTIDALTSVSAVHEAERRIKALETSKPVINPQPRAAGT
jgi:hypothetical protein